MYKVRWSDGTTYMTQDDGAAWLAFDAAQGMADLFIMSEVTNHWVMIADGHDILMGYDN